MMISAQQIRAARAMLNWSQETLAEESGLSLATIYNLEKGHLSPRSLLELRKAFESKGIEFFGRNGVNRRPDDFRQYAGHDGTEEFFADLLSVARDEEREFMAVFPSQEALALALGVEPSGNLGRLEQLGRIAKVRCLLSDIRNSGLFIPCFQFRAIARSPGTPFSVLVYGNKFALITNGDAGLTYLVFDSIKMSRDAYETYSAEWETAVPILAASNNRLVVS
ncbi:MAG: helix-turn-helix domain-containing protein [Alphaproteobacteria bacterium]|nr:helix-turn-helix domain-containing protein [Alphaproteobacteria bacterium]